jgi:FtsZ-binding cell division protein ZapB
VQNLELELKERGDLLTATQVESQHRAEELHQRDEALSTTKVRLRFAA